MAFNLFDKNRIQRRLERRLKKHPEITSSVFLLTVVAYFTSTLMTTIGGIIDGFVVGHTMGTAEVGALSLTSPIWFVTSILYSILAGATFSATSQAQMTMLFVIPFIIIAVNIFARTRQGFGWNFALMLPRGYGVPKEQELTASPRTVEEVMDFSRKAYDFCLKQSVRKREAYFVSLAAEEMANNVIKHGFKDKGYHTLDLRLIRKENALILRLRDNSHLFDPVKKLATVADNKDPGAYIGLRMVMKLASDVSYTSTLKLNNLRIRIDLPQESGSAA